MAWYEHNRQDPAWMAERAQKARDRRASIKGYVGRKRDADGYLDIDISHVGRASERKIISVSTQPPS